MKNFPNIEKSAFQRGAYVGYADGLVWRITKSTSSFGKWCARPIPWIGEVSAQARSTSLFAWTLEQMSERLRDWRQVMAEQSA